MSTTEKFRQNLIDRAADFTLTRKDYEMLSACGAIPLGHYFPYPSGENIKLSYKGERRIDVSTTFDIDRIAEVRRFIFPSSKTEATLPGGKIRLVLDLRQEYQAAVTDCKHDKAEEISKKLDIVITSAVYYAMHDELRKSPYWPFLSNSNAIILSYLPSLDQVARLAMFDTLDEQINYKGKGVAQVNMATAGMTKDGYVLRGFDGSEKVYSAISSVKTVDPEKTLALTFDKPDAGPEVERQKLLREIAERRMRVNFSKAAQPVATFDIDDQIAYIQAVGLGKFLETHVLDATAKEMNHIISQASEIFHGVKIPENPHWKQPKGKERVSLASRFQNNIDFGMVVSGVIIIVAVVFLIGGILSAVHII